MTLAVILGLYSVLAPSVPCASEAGLRSTRLVAQATPQASQEAPRPAEPPPASQTAQPPASNQTSPASETKPKPPSSTAKKHTHKKSPSSKTAEVPAKVVVPDGSTTDPKVQFSSGRNPTPAPNQVQGVNQLMDATESNLKQISTRSLNATQQDTVKQIRTYMDQARKAMDSGDAERARNLAVKAHLLSDDLVKH
jgi:hypothetical protein